MAQVKGVCVECRNDCDCQVNQYCGVGDIKIEKFTSSNVGTAGAFCTSEILRHMRLISFAIQYVICNIHTSRKQKNTLT